MQQFNIQINVKYIVRKDFEMDLTQNREQWWVVVSMTTKHLF